MRPKKNPKNQRSEKCFVNTNKGNQLEKKRYLSWKLNDEQEFFSQAKGRIALMRQVRMYTKKEQKPCG